MRQDRRLNGWVLISSVIQIILSIVLLSTGIALAIVGFLYQDKLATIDDLQFFIYQDFFIKFDLKLEFLYLFLGIAVAVIGLIILILAIITMTYAKKKKVVRRRVPLLIFALIVLAVAGCTATYLFLEFETLTDNIKYIAYGIIGAFGFAGLCNILGVMFGRSEQFMSNDNSKYAFDNSSLRSARVDVNNNVKNAQMQHPAGVQYAQSQYQPMQQRSNAGQGRYAPMLQQGYAQQPKAGGIAQRPQNQNMSRTMQANAVRQAPRPIGQATARPVQPMTHGANVNQPVRRVQQGVNSAQARPVNPRPVQPTTSNITPRPSAHTQATAGKYCVKCGKQLLPNERFCSLCGYKVNQ